MNGAPARRIVDTGAVATLLLKRLWEILEKETQKPLTEVLENERLVGVQGTPLKLIRTGIVQLQFGGTDYTSRVLVAEAITVDLIRGMDFLKANQCPVELGEKNFLPLTHEGIVLLLGSGQVQAVTSVTVTMEEALEIPPMSEMEIMARVPHL